MFASMGEGVSNNTDIFEAFNLCRSQSFEWFTAREEGIGSVTCEVVREPIYISPVTAHNLARNYL